MMTRMMILPPVEEAPFVVCVNSFSVCLEEKINQININLLTMKLCRQVNHPAVFLIRDNFTKLVLFIGRLSKPQ